MQRTLESDLKDGASATIFDYLNEDCLVEIFSYLDVLTVFDVVKADRRFSKAALTRYVQEKHVIIDSYWEEFDDEQTKDFFVETSKFIDTLYFEDVMEETVAWVTKLYPKLENLSISKVKFDTEGIVNILPTNLKVLRMDRCRINQKLLGNWFEKLSPTLRVLTYVRHHDTYYMQALAKLKGLESLKVDGSKYCFIELP